MYLETQIILDIKLPLLWIFFESTYIISAVWKYNVLCLLQYNFQIQAMWNRGGEAYIVMMSYPVMNFTRHCRVQKEDKRWVDEDLVDSPSFSSCVVVLCQKSRSQKTLRDRKKCH